MLVAQWVAIAVSVASVAFAGFALWVSIRNQRRTDAATERNDQRSMESNRLAAEANAIAREANATAQQALELAREQAARYVIPWALRYRAGNWYELVNDGNEPAYAVVLDGPNVHGGAQQHSVIDPHSAVRFTARVSRQLGFRDVVVTWHRREDRTDDQMSWTRPLPPPPRQPEREGGR